MVQPKQIRILIVDDSFFMRKLLREMLENIGDMTIVGEAANGVDAIGKAVALKPDVITMDYNMPEMNGAESTKKILALNEMVKPAIIIISAYTKEGVAETIECLRAGAVDFIQKPSGELSLDINKIKDEIIIKIRAASHAKIKQYKGISDFNNIKKSENINSTSLNKLVIIGSSTGGPPIVENIIAELPNDLDACVVVVQHMPKYFTTTFSKRLNLIAAIPVKEAETNNQLFDRSIFVAPGNSDICFVSKSQNNLFISIIPSDLDRGIHPSINLAMESASHLFSKNVIGVILSGMGEDGTKGCELIKNNCGIVIAQDPKTAVISSMPESAIAKGIVDYVLPPELIAKKITELCKKI